MVFEIENKVALITGGASGLGLCFAKELLRNGAKGVTLADINSENGSKALSEIEALFGKNRAIFVKTDVSVFKEFEGAFKETVKTFNNVDILINNAGVARENQWEKEIAVNVNGTINGIFLGIDTFLPNYKQGQEAVIVNISSVGGTLGFGGVPVYCSTKHAILGMVRSWGVKEFFEETKVRVLGICPGETQTSILPDLIKNVRDGKYKRFMEKYGTNAPQDPEFVAKETAKVIKWAPNGTIWVIEGGELAYEYVIPDRSTMKQNTLRCE